MPDQAINGERVTAAAVAAEAASTAADATTQAAKTAAAASTEAATAAAKASTQTVADTEQGRRRINLIWEITQATLALEIVTTILYIAVRDGDLPTSLGVLGATVLTTYFTRTNHTAMGGVGPAQAPESKQRRGE